MTPAERASTFFSNFLAVPFIMVLYFGWKLYSRQWRLWIPSSEMDITSGRRSLILGPDEVTVEKTWGNAPMRVIHALF